MVKEISYLITKVLRHKPEILGITIDNGYDGLFKSKNNVYLCEYVEPYMITKI